MRLAYSKLQQRTGNNTLTYPGFFCNQNYNAIAWHQWRTLGGGFGGQNPPPLTIGKNKNRSFRTE